jgi:general stress protein 26
MDSINQQQPEENRKNLAGKEAVEKMKELADKAESCFFCTEASSGGYQPVRPMAVQKIDDAGNVWFLSSDDSHKDAEIRNDSKVQLLFQGSAHAGFLSINGVATISKDKEKIKEFWQPLYKTWFTGGEDDPRITVIQVKPVEGYYWDNKNGAAVAFIKTVVGAITGKTLDDSIEGTLHP